MSDGEGDELHMSPVFLEGLDKGQVLVGLVSAFVFTPQVSTKSDLDDDEGASFLVEGGWIREWRVWYSPGVNEVRCRALAGGVELLDFLVRGDPLWDTAGG